MITDTLFTTSHPQLSQILLTTALASLSTWVIYFVFQPAFSEKAHLDQDMIIEEAKMNNALVKNPNDSSETTKKHLLSLIVPAYNEELRLPSMLLSTFDHLRSSKDEIITLCNDIINADNDKREKEEDSITITFEIIIVDDGSRDRTVQVVNKILEKTHYYHPLISIRLLSLKQNCGKGAAVKVGMLHSKGCINLMVDADNATNFQPSLLKLLQQMKVMKKQHQKQQSICTKNNINNNDAFIVFGSRAHLQEDSKAKRSFVRTVLMVAFHFFVKTLCSTMIHDTQCGFKLFTKDASNILFHNLHLTRWAFDTELVVIAERSGIPIAEVGVEWEEVDGSKLATSKIALLVSSVEMLRDMLCVKIMYTLGLWQLHHVVHDKTSCKLRNK